MKIDFNDKNFINYQKRYFFDDWGLGKDYDYAMAQLYAQMLELDEG